MRKHVLLAAILVAVAPLSQAASSASASLSNFQFQLEDRDTTDGITSSYQFLNDSTSGLTSLSANAIDKFGDSSSVKNKSLAFFQYDLSAASDKASSTAKVGVGSATTFGTSYTVGGALAFSTSARGSANGGNSSFDALASTGKGGSGVLGDLVLTAHSKLTITVDATVFAEASDPGGTGADWAQASSSLGLLVYGTNAGSFSSSLSAAASSGGFYDYVWNPSANKYEFKWAAGALNTDSKSKTLSLVFENTSAVTQKASLSFLSKVSGVGADPLAGAVPEPDLTLQVLAGLCAMGVAFRRTRAPQA